MPLRIGRSFQFHSETNRLPSGYCPEEQFPAQSTNDFLVFSVPAAVSLSAGWFLFHFRREGLIYARIPMVISFSLLLLRLQSRLDIRPNTNGAGQGGANWNSHRPRD